MPVEMVEEVTAKVETMEEYFARTEAEAEKLGPGVPACEGGTGPVCKRCHELYEY